MRRSPLLRPLRPISRLRLSLQLRHLRRSPSLRHLHRLRSPRRPQSSPRLLSPLLHPSRLHLHSPRLPSPSSRRRPRSPPRLPSLQHPLPLLSLRLPQRLPISLPLLSRRLRPRHPSLPPHSPLRLLVPPRHPSLRPHPVHLRRFPAQLRLPHRLLVLRLALPALSPSSRSVARRTLRRNLRWA